MGLVAFRCLIFICSANLMQLGLPSMTTRHSRKYKSKMAAKKHTPWEDHSQDGRHTHSIRGQVLRWSVLVLEWSVCVTDIRGPVLGCPSHTHTPFEDQYTPSKGQSSDVCRDHIDFPISRYRSQIRRAYDIVAPIDRMISCTCLLYTSPSPRDS